MKTAISLIFLLLLAFRAADAQSDHAGDPGDRALSLAFTSDAFAGMELGYAQNPGILQDMDFRVYLRCTLPLFLAVKSKSLQDWGVNMGARAAFLQTGKFSVKGDMQFYLLHHRQVLGSFLPLGYRVSLTPSHQFSKGYLGLQIHWDQTVATHIAHSSYVKEPFENLAVYDQIPTYSQPSDGWFRNTGSHLGIGIEGDRRIGSRLSLYGDLGILFFSSPYTGLMDAMMFGQVPVFGTLRMLYEF